MSPESVAKTDIVMLSWKAGTGDHDNFLMPLFNSSSRFSWGYSNEEVTLKMSDAKTKVNPREKEKAYREIQNLILEDCPWVLISHPKSTVVSKKYLDKAVLNVFGYPTYNDKFKI